jgi:hypothetical protein
MNSLWKKLAAKVVKGWSDDETLGGGGQGFRGGAPVQVESNPLDTHSVWKAPGFTTIEPYK